MTIYQIQCLLCYLKPGVCTVDGVYGQQTAQAIKDFQSTYGLVPDGDAGQLTQKMMLGVVSGTVAKKDISKTETTTVTDNNVGSKTGTFWDSIKHFRREEFRCQCGGKYCNGFPVEPHPNMVRGTDAIREWCGKPIVPASGVRCQAHNDELPGSVPNSWHVRGQAVDLSAPGKSDAEVEAFAKTLPHYYSSYIMSGGGVHIQFSAD